MAREPMRVNAQSESARHRRRVTSGADSIEGLDLGVLGLNALAATSSTWLAAPMIPRHVAAAAPLPRSAAPRRSTRTPRTCNSTAAGKGRAP